MFHLRLGVWLPPTRQPQQDRDQLHHQQRERAGRQPPPGGDEPRVPEPELPEPQHPGGGRGHGGGRDVTAATSGHSLRDLTDTSAPGEY